MSNTNFQTFHQMGQAINEVVRQATGRDNVQNIDMEHITVAQNHYYQDVDVSGRVVSFHAGAAGLPLEKCVVQIEPVQEGSGDPSPDNVRPITGWTDVKVYRAGENLEDATVFEIALPSEAGTVYGGTLDVVSGKLVINRALSVFEGNPSERWALYSAETGNNFRFRTDSLNSAAYGDGINGTQIANWLTSTVGNVTSGASVIITSTPQSITLFANARRIYVYVPDIISNESDINGWIAYLQQHPLTVSYLLAEPIEIIMSPTEIATLLGVNNIWSDAGDIEVKFKDLKELY